MTPPVILSIAGSDCSSGAGIQADLKVAHALGVFALTAVTCVVSEVPGDVSAIQAIEPELVADQVRICLETFPVAAVKTGMLYSPEIVGACAPLLRRSGLPLVVDPVMIATAGDPLMLESAITAYESDILPITTLLTPNTDELARLLGCGTITTAAQLKEATHALCGKYGCAVLGKGGHLSNRCHDILALPGGQTFEWTREKISGVSTHGTGCSLSSAIASLLAHGLPLPEAVSSALDFVAQSIAAHHRWQHHGLGIDALNHAMPSRT